ncbi:hypothetical protein L226DRAFT_520364 [Lentinus tigrinus ALCF2SS1-7]|nr:hypothetical protein L226DRAFT_520364 [Lentinus tigrinus ALCF2SS1-7]
MFTTHPEAPQQQCIYSQGRSLHDPTTETGLFKADIVQIIINKVFYKHSGDNRVIHDNIYQLFPMQGVTLVLTGIKCTIQEWASGIHQNINFNEKIYKSKYDIHYKNLQAYIQG